MKQKLTQKQQQRLSPQQLLATRLIQLDQTDLDKAIREELERNPMLEADEISTGGSTSNQDSGEPLFYYTAPASGNVSQSSDLPDLVRAEEPDSTDELLEIIYSSGFDDDEIAVAEEIIGSLDENGFLSETPLENIAYKLNVNTDFAENVLKKIQLAVPPGVAARDLRECMLLQLKHYHVESYVIEIIRKYFDYYISGDIRKIQQEMGLTDDMMNYARQVISALNPKPGRGREGIERSSIIPDVFLREKDGKFFISLNESGSLSVRLSEDYCSMLDSKNTNSETKQYLNRQKQSADWFIRAIQQRRQSILATAGAIIARQKDFFMGGIDYPRPMVMKEIAEDTNLDISTISRIVNGKYIQTPDTLYEMRYFFGEGVSRKDGRSVSSAKLQDDLIELIDNEDKEYPYNDEQLAELLIERQYQIARRTVSKYREKIGIPSSRERKK